MQKIVAIGGGEIGRPGFPVETTSIDKEIIFLSGKKDQNFFLYRLRVRIQNPILKLLNNILVSD